jgi:hypothetical protein
LERKSDTIVASGATQFSWLDFGVEDPSILIAKPEPEMSASFRVELPKLSLKKGSY